MRQSTKRRCACGLTLKYTFICVCWWTRQRIHNNFSSRYGISLMGDKTIPDSAEPRLESFYPPFVTGIDLPHQCVADYYNPHEPQMLIYHNQGVVDSLSCSSIKNILSYKNTTIIGVSQLSVCVLCYQLVYAFYQDSSPTNIKYNNHNDTGCRCTMYWCPENFVACIYVPINPHLMLGINRSLS